MVDSSVDEMNPIKGEDYQFTSKHDCVTFARRKIKEGAFKNCFYLIPDKNFNSLRKSTFYMPYCEQNSFIKSKEQKLIPDLYGCPKDCVFYRKKTLGLIIQFFKNCYNRIEKVVLNIPEYFIKLHLSIQILLILIVLCLLSKPIFFEIVKFYQAIK